VIAAGLVAVMASACAGGAPPPAACAAIGAGLLGGGGAVLGGKLKKNHDGGAYGAGAAIGAVVGGATGYAICSALQEEKKPAPAPAPAPVAPAPAPPVKEKIVLRGVNFDFNKSNIRPDAKVILDEAISILKRNPDVKVQVNGYTDGIGGDAYNLKLSDRRAASVVDYFAKGGLDKSRFTAKGFGKANPVASNDTAEGRAKNRRVELLTN
jgi:outer membrane protein OmpA-like peptidoglycan-associated protein